MALNPVDLLVWNVLLYWWMHCTSHCPFQTRIQNLKVFSRTEVNASDVLRNSTKTMYSSHIEASSSFMKCSHCNHMLWVIMTPSIKRAIPFLAVPLPGQLRMWLVSRSVHRFCAALEPAYVFSVSDIRWRIWREEESTRKCPGGVTTCLRWTPGGWARFYQAMCLVKPCPRIICTRCEWVASLFRSRAVAQRGTTAFKLLRFLSLLLKKKIAVRL